jgi:hypothetical protein
MVVRPAQGSSSSPNLEQETPTGIFLTHWSCIVFKPAGDGDGDGKWTWGDVDMEVGDTREG